MEAILRPPELPPTPAPTSGPFAVFRSPKGEAAVLGDNMFVEQLSIGGLGYYLSDADRAEYRRPYVTPGESRRPTLRGRVSCPWAESRLTPKRSFEATRAGGERWRGATA